MFASRGSNEDLVNLLDDTVRKAEPDQFGGRRIYVSLPVEYRERLTNLFEPTGADFIFLDPSEPISQRQERIDQKIRDGAC